jgi:hypothetical protein
MAWRERGVSLIGILIRRDLKPANITLTLRSSVNRFDSPALRHKDAVRTAVVRGHGRGFDDTR